MTESKEGDDINIKTLFEECNLDDKGDGTYDLPCPQCGMWGGRTNSLVLNVEKNTAFCRSSQKWFTAFEAYSMKKGIIKCLDGREKGQKDSPLNIDSINETLSSMKDEYDSELYEEITSTFNLNDKPEVVQPGTGKLISSFAREVSQYLKDKNEIFYRPNNNEVVEIGKIKLHKNGEDCYTGFQTITASRFITKIEKYISPCTRIFIEKTNEWKIKPKSITKELAATLLECHELQQSLPQISRIFTVPIPILYNGELTFPIKGYDYRFGSWLPYNAPELTHPNITLEESKKILEGIYSEFCFQTNQDKTNAIAGLLTPYLRGIYSDFNIRSPIYCYIGNRERVGKDYCAGITGIVHEGFALDDNPISTSENSKGNNTAELGKKILGAMLAGRKRLHFANNKGHIDNAILEAVLTARKWSDRILSRNKNPTLDNEIDYSMSGNIGISYTPDFINRARFVRLFLDIEDANSRKFEFQNGRLHEWVENNRGLILSALYKLVKKWVDNKSPEGKLQFASYPEWARICGGIMECAGYDSPCTQDKESIFVGVGGDSETTDMKRLFEICNEQYPNKAISKQVVRSLAIENELFNHIDFNKQSGVVQFSNKLNKFIGRILSDIRLTVSNPAVRLPRQELIFSKIDEISTHINEITLKITKNDAYSGSLGSLGTLPLLPDYKNGNPLLESEYKNTTNTTNTTKLVKKGRIKKEVTKNKVKEERQIQFWEHPETKDIEPTCKEEDVLNWIKNNPGTNYKEIYQKFNIGSIRFKAQLIETGLVKDEDGKLFIGDLK